MAVVEEEAEGAAGVELRTDSSRAVKSTVVHADKTNADSVILSVTKLRCMLRAFIVI